MTQVELEIDGMSTVDGKHNKKCHFVLKFQELADFFYFSSLEESDLDAVILDMYDGDNACLISKCISKYNGMEETCAIGFIQVSE